MPTRRGIPPEKRIQPGESRNPKGSSAKARTRAAVKRIVKEMGKTMTPDDIARIISPIVLGKHKDMAPELTDPDVTSAQAYVAKLWADGYEKNSLVVFKTLIEMVIGKPKERTTMELSGKDGSPIEVKSKAELLATAMALRKQVDSLGDE